MKESGFVNTDNINRFDSGTLNYLVITLISLFP